MKIKQYRLKLKKISRREYEVFDGLQKLLSYGSPIKQILGVLSEELSGIINKHVEFERVSWREQIFSRFSETASVNSINVVISMAPISKPIFLTMDRSFVLRLIDSSLGGDGSEHSNRTLSETELGILDYLIVKILLAVKSSFKKPVFSFQLENVVDDPKLLKEYALSQDNVVEIVYKVSCEGYDSLVKLVFPDPIVNQILTSDIFDTYISDEEKKDFKDKMKRYGYIEIPVVAEIGETMVDSSDLDALGSGDVILLDNPTVSLDQNVIKGSAKIKLGDTALDQKAELDIKKNSVLCKIKF